VIIGAGFGGLEAAKKLAGETVRVTVVDRTNYHLFQPLLYQVATAALSPADIAAPVRAILSKSKNMEVILAEVESIDVNAKKVRMVVEELDYDYLIVATGARHSYFGHPEWEKLAPGLKSLEDAVEIRRRILLAFEYAERVSDEAARKAAMTFVVVGGGPTGVERFPSHRSVASARDSGRSRPVGAGRVSGRFADQRQETTCRSWSGSAHRHSRDQSFGGRFASR
jgi:NADH dehydrogenase